MKDIRNLVQKMLKRELKYQPYKLLEKILGRQKMDVLIEFDLQSYKIGNLKKETIEALYEWSVEDRDLDYLYQLNTRDADIKIAVTKDRKKAFVKITLNESTNKETD